MREGLNIRLERNGLKSVSGTNFRDLRDGKSPHLSALTENHGLIGIESDDEKKFTIMGLRYLYFKYENNEISKIELKTAFEYLSAVALMKGKLSEYEYIPTENEKKFWVRDKGTMSALWNTALFISRLRK